DIQQFWKNIYLVDDIFCNYKIKNLNQQKCSENTCLICQPPQCPHKIFNQLCCLFDPIPGTDLYYKPFEELYSTITTEKYRPSHREQISITKPKQKRGRKKRKVNYSMPFCPSSIRAKNVGITVTCVECDKLLLLFSAKRLKDKNYQT
ncbi:28190_t:CDS:2, partial [Gigaspora margarita]